MTKLPMNRRYLQFFPAMLALGVLAACSSDHPAIALMDQVTVTPLDAQDDAARFRLSLQAQPAQTYLDHFTALSMTAGRSCVDRSFSIQSEGPEIPDLQATPAAGEVITEIIGCSHDLLPGYQDIKAGGHPAWPALREGSQQKSAYRTVRKGERELLVANSLVGGFLREAYTEECAGKALLVEHIALAGEPTAVKDDEAVVKNLHGTLQYRCVDLPPVASSPPQP